MMIGAFPLVLASLYSLSRKKSIKSSEKIKLKMEVINKSNLPVHKGRKTEQNHAGFSQSENCRRSFWWGRGQKKQTSVRDKETN